jgi:hypothetical protein
MLAVFSDDVCVVGANRRVCGSQCHVVMQKVIVGHGGRGGRRGGSAVGVCVRRKGRRDGAGEGER